MKALYKRNKRNTIASLAAKNNLSKNDICRIMNICKPTLEGWIEDCGVIRYRDICTMAGLFGLSVIDFVYMLPRNKTKLTKDDRWFIENSLKSKEEGLPTD